MQGLTGSLRRGIPHSYKRKYINEIPDVTEAARQSLWRI